MMSSGRPASIALIGSVSSSWHALDALIRNRANVTCVLGVDDSEANRISDFRSLRTLATNASIPFQSFVKVSDSPVEPFLRSHTPDMLWVIGLSQLVPDRLISIAPMGGVGFHPTMLPEGRGRAPVAWTILKNARAAANLFFLTDQPDAGDIIVQREVPVLPDDYSEDLIQRTNEVLAAAIQELAPQLNAGVVPRTPQDHSKATFYPKRTPADGVIDWSRPAGEIYRLIRAAGRPYPGAFSHSGGKKLTIWRARPDSTHPIVNSIPGTVLEIDDNKNVLIAAGDDAVRLTEFEIEGCTDPLDALKIGETLESPAKEPNG